MAEVIAFPAPAARVRSRLEPLRARLNAILSPVYAKHRRTLITLDEILSLMLDILERDGFDPRRSILDDMLRDDLRLRRIAANSIMSMIDQGLLDPTAGDEQI